MKLPELTRRLVVLVGLFVLVGYGLAGLATGVSVDNDAHALMDSFQSILDGQYHPSRTSGFPLYEFTGAAIFGFGGQPAVMVFSLVCTVVALILMLRPTQALRRGWGTAAWLSLALAPAVMTNSSAVMETSLLLLLVSAVLWTLTSQRLSRPTGALALAVLSAGLILTRADAVLFLVALTLGCLCWARSVGRIGVRLALSVAAGGVVGFVLLFAVTRRFPLSSGYLPEEAVVRRLLRGAVGFTTAFGPVGVISLTLLVAVLILLAIKVSRGPRAGSSNAMTDPDFVLPLLIGAVLLYGLRFFALSDEIEYLLPLLPLLAACTVFLMDQYRLAGILSLVTLVSVALTGLISVPLLARSDPWLPEPSPSIGLGWGAWRQDLATRSAAGTRSSDEYQDFLVRSLGPLEEDVASGQAALMPRDSWHYVRNAGYRSYYEDMTYVIGCRELTTEVLIPPWRVSQPMGDFNDVSAFEQGQLLRCERVAQLLPDRIEPINEGRTAGSDASYPR